MRRYETIFIVRPNVAEDEIAAITTKASSIIEGDGGATFKVNNWGLKKLAYLINKENQGYYVHVDYAAIPASVQEMERIFRIDDRVLKYLTVKLADACDPEAVKEELSQAEAQAEETAAEQEAQEEKPAAQEEKPDAQEEKPAAQEEKPEAQEEKPASGAEEKPEAQEEKPASGAEEKTE